MKICVASKSKHFCDGNCLRSVSLFGILPSCSGKLPLHLGHLLIGLLLHSIPITDMFQVKTHDHQKNLLIVRFSQNSSSMNALKTRTHDLGKKLWIN